MPEKLIPVNTDNSQTKGAQPLPQSLKHQMEIKFGRDFSDVLIYQGTPAASAATTIGAKPFTHGSNIFFGAGQYQPGTEDGRKLIAHELTHVVQQSTNKSIEVPKGLVKVESD